MVRWLLEYPDRMVVYAGYGAQLAVQKSKTVRRMAQQAGLRIMQDSRAATMWRTPEGGGMLATGVGGPLTGWGCQWLVIDDPVKNREEAESATIRRRNWEWYQDVALTRVEPKGSVILISTRWHTDDLAGKLAREPDTKTINLPAINDNNEALCPSRWPLEVLNARKATLSPYGWESLYQGRPVPKGGSVFEGVRFHDIEPAHMRLCIGVDFAYTSHSRSDYSVAVVLGEADGRIYVLDVIRQQTASPLFALALRELKAKYDQAPLVAYAGGTERGAIDFFGKPPYNVPIKVMAARADKFSRAQRAAGTWSAGLISLRRGPWNDAFVEEFLSFTGLSDPHDDIVDALVAAHDVLVRPSDPYTLTDFEAPQRRI